MSRLVLAAVCVAVVWALPASAFAAPSVTIAAPAGAKVGPHPALAATVSGAADTTPTVTFSVGSVSAPATAVTFSGGAWHATGTLDLSSLAEQTYTLTAGATDPSGASAATKSVTLDLSVRLGLPVRVITNDPSVAITTDPDVTLDCRIALRGSPLPDFTTSCSNPWHPVLAADGVYDYEVRATDDVGNTFTNGSSLTLDRTPPVLVFSDGPAEGATVTTPSVTMSFATADTNADKVECALDAAAYGACTTAASHTAAGLAPGTHAIHVRAVDKALNTTAITRTLTVSDGSATPTATPTPTASPVVLGASAATPTPVYTTPAIAAKVSLSATRTRGWTRLRTLQLRNVPTGAAVKATCKGRGCPPRALRVTAKTATLSLKALTGRTLKPGTVIAITLQKAGMTAQRLTITIRSTAAPLVR